MKMQIYSKYSQLKICKLNKFKQKVIIKTKINNKN